ncbi:MAG TPA: 2'-5' RNA ligase family protein [Puia sp.]|jgi:2'-5' RNA ligase|nr:2'-5' RNA ligase family protein [Puia sp.]
MEMGLVQTTETLKEVRGRGRPSGPGYAEYLLVVYPDGDLQDRLLEEQQQFSTDYGLDHRLDQGQRGANPIGRNKPHITLAAFHAGEEAEDTLIRWIQRICSERRSFEIALNNYSGIPPHTPKPPDVACIPGAIYLRVQNPEPLREVTQQLGAIDEFIRSSGWPPVHFTGRPHLSIAGGLTEQVYNKAMPDYSRKIFHGIFRVGELVLLKRKHTFDPCKTVNVFGLKN